MWVWTHWVYATDSGLFDGRWDDQNGDFRTLYTADSLLGCLLELLARFRPSASLDAALDEIVDDDGTLALYPDAPSGCLGHSWLEDRLCGSAVQSGRYCFITHSRSLSCLRARFPFARHDIAAVDVDAALIKDARNRKLTRSIARWVYDLPAGPEGGRIDGIEFRSRHGDEIRMWAVFERPDDQAHSGHLSPMGTPESVPDDLPELLEAFDRHGLRWND
jgi:hypothetical protein